MQLGKQASSTDAYKRFALQLTGAVLGLGLTWVHAVTTTAAANPPIDIVHTSSHFGNQSNPRFDFEVLLNSHLKPGGTWMRTRRWEGPIQIELGPGITGQRERTVRAGLQQIQAIIGLPWQIVRRADEGQRTLKIDSVAWGSPAARRLQLTENSPCFTELEGRSGESLGVVRVKMLNEFVEQCLMHELLHGFGLPGHPNGNTLLSYGFGSRQQLRPLDKVMLMTLYSDEIRSGQSPLEFFKFASSRWVLMQMNDAEHLARLRDEMMASLLPRFEKEAKEFNQLTQGDRLQSLAWLLSEAYASGTLSAPDPVKGKHWARIAQEIAQALGESSEKSEPRQFQ